jgi:hypothetical protein
MTAYDSEGHEEPVHQPNFVHQPAFGVEQQANNNTITIEDSPVTQGQRYNSANPQDSGGNPQQNPATTETYYVQIVLPPPTSIVGVGQILEGPSSSTLYERHEVEENGTSTVTGYFQV